MTITLIQRRRYAERYEDAQIEAHAWAQYQKQTEHHK